MTGPFDPAPAGAPDNPPSRKLPGPIEAAIGALIEVAQSTDGFLLEDQQQVDAAVEQLREAIRPSLLPPEMTPAIAAVLGMQIFRAQPLGWLFRAAGAEIPPKIEAEQAFVLFRFLHVALSYGDDWKRVTDQDVRAARDEAGKRTAAAEQQTMEAAP